MIELRLRARVIGSTLFYEPLPEGDPSPVDSESTEHRIGATVRATVYWIGGIPEGDLRDYANSSIRTYMKEQSDAAAVD